MGYTITNNIMYVRDDTGNLVPVSMIASGADQTIRAIKDTASSAEAQIDTKVSDANAAIESKTDEQLARIPDVTAMAEDVTQLKDDVADITPDDMVVNGKPWTSKKTVDALCTPFESSGDVVQCNPVEGYPLGVKSRIDAVQQGTGEAVTVEERLAALEAASLEHDTALMELAALIAGGEI